MSPENEVELFYCKQHIKNWRLLNVNDNSKVAKHKSIHCWVTEINLLRIRDELIGWNAADFLDDWD